MRKISPRSIESRHGEVDSRHPEWARRLLHLPRDAVREAREILSTLDADALIRWISGETPQVAATILCLVSGSRRVEFTRRLPDKVRMDILLAAAKMGPVDEASLDSLIEVAKDLLERELPRAGRLSGRETVANAFIKFDGEMRQRLLDELRERDPDFAAFLLEQLLTVARLASLSVPDLARVCSALSNRDIVLALRMEPEPVRSIWLTAVSRSRAEEIRCDLDAKRPEKRADAEAAAAKAAAAATKLHEAGQILFPWEDKIVA